MDLFTKTPSSPAWRSPATDEDRMATGGSASALRVSKAAEAQRTCSLSMNAAAWRISSSAHLPGELAKSKSLDYQLDAEQSAKIHTATVGSCDQIYKASKIPTIPLTSPQPQFGKGRMVKEKITLEKPSTRKNTIRMSASERRPTPASRRKKPPNLKPQPSQRFPS